MLINQTPADWWNLIPPINQMWEDLEKTREQLRILTNYVDHLEKRVEKADIYINKVKTVKVNRQKKEHWVSVAKRDLITLKERRKKEGLGTGTAFKGLELYREVVKYKKLRDQKSPEALKQLERIFVNGN